MLHEAPQGRPFHFRWPLIIGLNDVTSPEFCVNNRLPQMRQEIHSWKQNSVTLCRLKQK